MLHRLRPFAICISSTIANQPFHDRYLARSQKSKFGSGMAHRGMGLIDRLQPFQGSERRDAMRCKAEYFFLFRGTHSGRYEREKPRLQYSLTEYPRIAGRWRFFNFIFISLQSYSKWAYIIVCGRRTPDTDGSSSRGNLCAPHVY